MNYEGMNECLTYQRQTQTYFEKTLFLIDSALLFEALHTALYTMDSAFYLPTHMFEFWDLFATVTTQSSQIMQTYMLLYQIKKK